MIKGADYKNFSRIVEQKNLFFHDESKKDKVILLL